VPCILAARLLGAQIGRRAEDPIGTEFGQVMLGPVELPDEFLDQPDPQGRLYLDDDDLLTVVRNDVELIVLPVPSALAPGRCISRNLRSVSWNNCQTCSKFNAVSIVKAIPIVD